MTKPATPVSAGDDRNNSTVIYDRVGSVATIALNRPERRNALSATLLGDLNRAIDRLCDDPGASVCLLRGHGPSFCAGFDLTARSESTASTKENPWGDRGRLRSWLEASLRLWEAPTPVIAEVQGHCLAGGNLFILCADIVYIAEDCVVGWPKLPVGGGFLDGALAHLVGIRRAKELSFTIGSEIDGRTAAEWGLANHAVPAAELQAAAAAAALALARVPRNILQIRKASINRATSGLNFRDALLAGAEWDAIAHVDPVTTEVRGFVREHGMKTVVGAFASESAPLDTLRRLPDPHVK